MERKKQLMISATIVVAILIIGVFAALVYESSIAGSKDKDNDDDNDDVSSSVDTLNVGMIGSLTGIESMGTVKYLTIQEFLFTTDQDSNFVPCLADSYETTDNKVWTFHLNQSATWHDGVPFTSADVKFTIEYMLEKGTYLPDNAYLVDVDKVETPNNHTVVITLKNPDSMLMWNMRIGLRISPEHIYKDVSDPRTYNDINSTIGTGPYKYVSMDVNAGLIRFVANEDYYRGVPNIKNLVLKFYRSADVMVLALKSGQIDTIYDRNGVSYYYTSSIQKQDGLAVAYEPTSAVRALLFNNNKAPFTQLELRQAVKYALDYEEMMNICIGGFGTVANEGMVPTTVPYYKETTGLQQNQTQAEALLDSLGYVDIDEDGFREYPNGSKFQPELLIATGDDYSRPAEMIKTYLNEVGIDVKVTVAVAWKPTYSQYAYDMIIGWTAPVGTYATVGYATTIMDGTTGGMKLAQIFDPDFTEILNNIRAATTSDQMRTAAYAIQDYYADEVPGVALYWYDVIQPYNTKYTGYVFDQFYGVLNYETYFNLQPA
jgi:peptide/nickel transport system substrate-binding protein